MSAPDTGQLLEDFLASGRRYILTTPENTQKTYGAIVAAPTRSIKPVDRGMTGEPW